VSPIRGLFVLIVIIWSVNAKLAEQHAFVAWWDARVGVRHGPGRGIKNAPTGSFSVVQAEAQTQISQQTVSKWRTLLKPENIGDYRRRLILGPMREQHRDVADNRWSRRIITRPCGGPAMAAGRPA
jgi:hypothetical protein